MKRILLASAVLALAACGQQKAETEAPLAVNKVAFVGSPKVSVATLEQLPAPLPNPYDDKADAKADIDKAFAAAQTSGKRVLINYGGNWCSWCRGLEGVMLLPEVKPFIDANFEVVHVSTGATAQDMNSRPETYRPFGVEKIDGTPYLVIAEPDRTVVHKGSEVTDEQHETPQAMVNWLSQFAKKGAA